MNNANAVFLTGKAVLPQKPVELHAGQLTVHYENGGVRYIKSGDVEIIRMIYSAVRDHNWGAVEPVIRDEQIENFADSFRIRYLADYKQNDIAFEAEYTITGSAKGIRFAMRGTATSSFKKNRIGFCILHPIKECAGKTCVVHHPDGSQLTGTFPQHISPQQPFKNIQSMRWQPADGIDAKIVYSGDVFEMEDQRNWIDASYKTYCTPLDIPFPVHIETGQVIEQVVELKVSGTAEQTAASEIIFSISNQQLCFPHIGIGASSQQKKLDEKSAALIKNLGLHHYRIDVYLTEKNWQRDLSIELTNAAKINTKVEAALHINPKDLAAVAACVKQLKVVAKDVASLVVFNVEKKSTDGELLERVVPDLCAAFPDALVGAGTDCFFTELNRDRTPTDRIDFLTFSINPQVHAFDNQSLTETLEAHAYVVESARAFANGKAIHISPVTFNMRFNPNATGEPTPTAGGELPATVDPRQMSLYGAAWTLGSIKYCAESGADFITWFETVGWRGIMQGDQDSELPEKFAATKGHVFPIWQIFKWIMEFKSGAVIPVKSSQPMIVDGLMLEHDGKRRLIVANYTLQPQVVQLPHMATYISVLDEHSVEAFYTTQGVQKTEHGRDKIELLSYGVACIDF